MPEDISQDAEATLSRYTIHVPEKDKYGNDIPHVLAYVRQALSNAGLHGRVVTRSVQGDWQSKGTLGYATHFMSLVTVDAPNTPEALEIIKTISGAIKELTEQEAVYITKQPLEVYLI